MVGAQEARLREVGLPEPPAAIRQILEHPTLQGARFGALAVSVPDGEILLAQNADELFSPASVVKLFTTAGALWRLQPHFVWRTPVAYRGEHVADFVQGDLWVLGRGAPDLVEERLFLAAQEMRDLGVGGVSGDLVVDDRYFDSDRYGEGWPEGSQTQEAYHTPISGLMANFAAVRIQNEWRSVPDPAIHFGSRLLQVLGLSGIEVRGRVRRPTEAELGLIETPAFAGEQLGAESVPHGLTHLYTIRSEPLGRLVMDINKFSNNVMAESVLKTLGAIEYGAPGTATKGRSVVASFLQEEVGIPLNSYVQVDGSGLSPLDRFSPGQVVRLLTWAYGNFHIGPELVASLKLSGLDGWNPAPFKHPPLAGELRVKSGHIRGVNALGGYMHTGSGRVVAFCAMVNDHRAGQWEIDQRMAEIAGVLIRDY